MFFVSDINVAILGLGTVGQGVYQLIKNYQEKNQTPKIFLKYIFVRNKKKAEDLSTKFKIDLKLFTWNIETVIKDLDIDIVVETMGGVDTTHEILLDFIKHKKNIVSANKDLIALKGESIFEAVKKQQTAFLFEAAVAGGIPIINTLKQSLAANKIEKLYGIINGTTNYILDMMKNHNLSFEQALKDAQQLGFAESDPTNDVAGHDAAFKTAILASIISNKRVDVQNIYREGIEKITAQDINAANKKNYVIKLLGIIDNQDTELDARVHPVFVSKSHPLAKVDAENNAIFVQGNAVQDLTIIGKGAGSLPTASAVMSDVLIIASALSQKQNVNLQLSCQHSEYAKLKNFAEIKNCFYLRLVLEDKIGVLKDLGGVMADMNANVKFINQYENQNNQAHADVFTDPISEATMQKMLEKLKLMDSIRSVESVIRVLA